MDSILLPPDLTGVKRALPSGAKCLTIIGANGAGKTRFTNYFAKSLGQQAYRLSALRAIYNTGEQNTDEYGIDSIFQKARQSPAFLANASLTTFERLMALLLNEEIAALVEFKAKRINSPANNEMPETTKLDKVIASWKEIFTVNKVLRQGGHLMFSRDGETDIYSQMRLSDGEKTVLYYFGAILYAPKNGIVFVDSPEMFLHPSLQQKIWDTMEALRPDCRFIFTTHDLDFTSTRQRDALLWVRGYDPSKESWDYALLPREAGISDEIYMAIIGSRKPVLFIEGDNTHSIDAKLYPLVFKNYTVKSLGSCDKVIESTRTFNDQRTLHHLVARGIVDRDRREEAEVAYLRGKNIFVPNVAEIENILMIEEVVRAVAKHNGQDENRVFKAVKRSIISMFSHELRAQAMQHTRHRIKRLMERRVDGRFTNINDYEHHLSSLAVELNPRGIYEKLCREFSRYVETENYAAILRVFNHKSMLPGSNVSSLCGLSGSTEAYIANVLSILRQESPASQRIRTAITQCFGLDSALAPAP